MDLYLDAADFFFFDCAATPLAEWEFVRVDHTVPPQLTF